MYIILLGAPGAGKGTQAAYLAQKLNLVHIASGDLFRQALEQDTDLGRQARSFMEDGALVPDEITTKMVLERLADLDCESGVVLDGFPRNLPQAEALDKALIGSSRAIDSVVYIRVSPEVILRRLSGRWICRNCQAPYHELDSLPQVKGRCDRCGGELYQRPDDIAETVKKRLMVYFGETAPLIDYYTRTGRLVEVDGEGSVEDAGKRVVAVLERVC